jgi:lipoprotein NlpI
MRLLTSAAAVVLIALGPAIAGGLDLAKAGLTAQRKGDWDRAMQFYQQALEAGDLSPAMQARVHGLRANAYGIEGLHDKAGADFAAAMALTPNDPAPYVGRSILDRQMANYTSAMADASAAIALKPDYVLAYTNRGLAEFYAGRFAAAEDFAKSQAADPGEPDFVLWLHLARARAGQDDKDELARNAARLDPEA